MSKKQDHETVHEVASFSSHESHVFDDPERAEYYRDVYEKASYEGRHLFDPKFEWTKAEETKVVRKTDWHVALWSFIMFLALNFDRQNISQALAGGMLDDLGLSDNDYNVGNTVNLVCFLLAELPSQLISKKVGPDLFVPLQISMWSIVAALQCRVTNKAGFLVTRALVGLLEGGFIPDVFTWLSLYYTSHEIPHRLSIFYSANPVSSILTSLIAYGVFSGLGGARGMEGWRWLFLIEGMATLLCGIAAFFLMAPSPAQTKTKWRPKGWYTDREEKIMINRVLRDDPSKGDMNNREAVPLKGLLWSLLDYDLLPVYIIRFCGDLGHAPATNYLSLILRRMGFDELKTDLLLIPYNAGNLVGLYAVNTLFFAWTKSHWMSYALQPIWHIPCLFALLFWPGLNKNVWGTYALLTIFNSAPPLNPMSNSWTSINSNTVRARTVSSALVNIAAQASGIAAANVYKEDDKPLYKRGNSALLGVAFTQLAAIVFAKLWYTWRNRTKSEVWDSMTEEEKLRYIKTTSDQGNKRLDFQFSY